MIEVGQRAPEFTLPGICDGERRDYSLSEYRGKKVVIAFYPGDFTPGCTRQACELRDSYADFRARGAVILGVSPDDEESHGRFREKFGLPFPLLVDKGAKVAVRYGAWGEKTLYGRKVIGMTRSTFIIGPDGRLLRVWKRARAAGHGEAVLKALQDINRA